MVAYEAMLNKTCGGGKGQFPLPGINKAVLKTCRDHGMLDKRVSVWY